MTKSVFKSFRIPESLNAAIKRESKRHGVSESEAMRTLLELGVKASGPTAAVVYVPNMTEMITLGRAQIERNAMLRQMHHKIVMEGEAPEDSFMAAGLMTMISLGGPASRNDLCIFSDVMASLHVWIDAVCEALGLADEDRQRARKMIETDAPRSPMIFPAGNA